MPDGDKFYWGVRGTGSRTMLNLIRSGAALGIIADQGAKVVAAQLKKPVVQRVLCASLGILECGLPRVETDSSLAGLLADEVRAALHRLRRELDGDDFAAVALRAAENTFEHLSSSGRSLTQSELKRELRNSCVTAVLGLAVFDAKRPGLMSETGRSATDELLFERSVMAAVGERLMSTSDRVFEGASSIRSPRRRSPRETFTLEKLHAPLPTVLH